MKGRARRDGSPQGATLVVLQREGRLREKLADPLDARQSLPFRRNLLVFSFFRLHPVYLSDLEIEQLEPLNAVLRRLVKAREVALGAEELAKERGPLRRPLPEASEPVEELASYEVPCSELCGLGHFQMRTTMQVLSEADFEQWKQQQAANK